MTVNQLATVTSVAVDPSFTNEDLRTAIDEAIAAGCRAVMINGSSTKFCTLIAQDRGIKIVTTVGGFPHGRVPVEVKAFEAREAVRRGADELAIVVNIGGFKECSPDYIYKEVLDIVEIADGRPVSAIIESGYLSEDQLVKAALIAVEAGATWIQVTTGFGPRGATAAEVAALRAALPKEIGIEAHGVTAAKIQELADAGADRFGIADAPHALFDSTK